ncbi:hypothetical protein [Lentzea californiensis]|uniref:hypothetical protein n=1 Tax=Lentzea californiensis TaxID=438851 RepID=UPI002165F8AC|nr:hypothetical protein [Lentzea californiensis]
MESLRTNASACAAYTGTSSPVVVAASSRSRSRASEACPSRTASCRKIASAANSQCVLASSAASNGDVPPAQIRACHSPMPYGRIPGGASASASASSARASLPSKASTWASSQSRTNGCVGRASRSKRRASSSRPPARAKPAHDTAQIDRMESHSAFSRCACTARRSARASSPCMEYTNTSENKFISAPSPTSGFGGTTGNEPV